MPGVGSAEELVAASYVGGGSSGGGDEAMAERGPGLCCVGARDYEGGIKAAGGLWVVIGMRPVVVVCNSSSS
jgi:hypothetical protein